VRLRCVIRLKLEQVFLPSVLAVVTLETCLLVPAEMGAIPNTVRSLMERSCEVL
jgi:hypothetical protein